MASSLHLFILLARFIVHTSAVCVNPNDQPNCALWVPRGLCTGGYSDDRIQLTCPLSCAGICPPTATTKPTPSENANCGKWSADSASAFCVKANAEQKKLFCAKTCAFEVAPTSDCAVYGTSNGVFKRVSTANRNNNNTPDAVVPISSSATVVPQYIYASSRCAVTLYDKPAEHVIPHTATTVGRFPGAAGNFQKITDTSAISYTCACTRI